MNILFLTMNTFTDIDMHNIYSDLMKVFIKNGHRPYIVTPREKQAGEQTDLVDYDTYSLLKVRIGNTSNVSLIEKGISTVTLSRLYYQAVLSKLGHLSFGLILYSTPPITLVGPIKKLKKRFECRTYLMLKDIFPQNAVDLGMFKGNGIIHWYFRRQEKDLYSISDRIGCMSAANVQYLLIHNKEVNRDKVEICPNGIIPHPIYDRHKEITAVRSKYSIPESATVFLYGGNLGKPQGIPHLLKCLEANVNKNDRYFIICGSGSEYPLIDDYIKKKKPSNIKLVSFLPKNEYDELAAGCDVGLIFLDSRFTIPNYPSRILSYMENGIPVLVCSDKNTDVGTDAVENGYGLFCYADDPKAFTNCIEDMNESDISLMGKQARNYLEENFTAERCYRIIMQDNTNGGDWL